MTAIITHDPNGVIALDGKIPWRYAEDRERLRRAVDGAIVCGSPNTIRQMQASKAPIFRAAEWCTLNARDAFWVLPKRHSVIVGGPSLYTNPGIMARVTCILSTVVQLVTYNSPEQRTTIIPLEEFYAGFRLVDRVTIWCYAKDGGEHLLDFRTWIR